MSVSMVIRKQVSKPGHIDFQSNSLCSYS